MPSCSVGSTVAFLPACLLCLPACPQRTPPHLVSTPVLILIIIPEVNHALRNSLHWSLFVIVSVLEPNTGAECVVGPSAAQPALRDPKGGTLARGKPSTPVHRRHTAPLLPAPALLCSTLPLALPACPCPVPGGAIFKGLQRLVGTVLAGALGVGTQYLVYLLNGLSYSNNAWKFAAMTLLLSVETGGLAAASVRFPRYACEHGAVPWGGAGYTGHAAAPTLPSRHLHSQTCPSSAA